MATSGHGGVGPYVGVCVLVGGVGIADGTAQGALVGDLSFMDPHYIQVFHNLLIMWNSSHEDLCVGRVSCKSCLKMTAQS